MLAVWIVLGVVLLLVLFGIFAYNGLVRLRNRIENAWSQIDVQLRRRYDLIPNLVETVKGYAAHERETFESVTKARADATYQLLKEDPSKFAEPRICRRYHSDRDSSSISSSVKWRAPSGKWPQKMIM